MQINIQAKSHVGAVRKINQDMLLVDQTLIRDHSLIQSYRIPNDTQRLILAVADGMGGHKGGEVASEMVLSDLKNFILTLPPALSFEEISYALRHWLGQINQRVDQEGQKPETLRMGTTLTGIFFYENLILNFNVGDSRIYRLRQELLSRLTTDHSARELGGSPDAPSNIILNCIGAGGDVFMDIEDMTERVIDQDYFILCSDGLNDMIDDDSLEEIACSFQVDNFIEQAIQNGGRDNVSVLTAKVQLDTEL